MGATMLHGVLNMPPELWQETELDKQQRYSRYMEASRRIEDLERALNEFVTEYCNREGEEDTPKTADEQECTLVANAMRLLDS